MWRTPLSKMVANLVLGALHLASLASALASGDIQNYLKTELSSSSEVLLSSDQSYDTEIKERWNAYDAPTFVVGVKPATVEDVATIVSLAKRLYFIFFCITEISAKIRYASNNSIPFLGTGGGHGYTTTTSALKDRINIDLGNFKQVSVDPTASTVTIGGAVTFGEVLDPVYKAGKEIRELFFPTFLELALKYLPTRDRILFLCWHDRSNHRWRYWRLSGSPWLDHRCARVRYHCDWKGRHRQCVAFRE